MDICLAWRPGFHVQEVIPMRRSPYSTVSVKDVCIDSIVSRRRGQRCIVGVDAAKLEQVLCLYWGHEDFDRPWLAKAPTEIRLVIQKLQQLQKDCPVVIAMESSGVYGDALRQAAGDAGIPVQRVSSKAVKDYAESFDGVPSQHDGKEAAVIGELCYHGKSKPWSWQQKSEQDQAIEYWVRKLDGHQRIKQVFEGQFEALVSRHWPEAPMVLPSAKATLLHALAQWGGPASLVADPKAADVLKSIGGRWLSEQKIAELIESGRSTVGVRATSWSSRELMRIAQEILDLRKKIAECRRELKAATANNTVITAQAEGIGHTTACVLWMCVGDPRNYPSAAAYRKAMGLNLKERSSGQYEGQLRLTKRGRPLSRKWLYFAALRAMKYRRVKRWVERKKRRDGGKGGRAVTAVMRRLALAAWHVGLGRSAYDAGKLFPGSGGGAGGKKRAARPSAQVEPVRA